MSVSTERRRDTGRGPTPVAGPVTQPGVDRPGAGPAGDRRRRRRAQRPGAGAERGHRQRRPDRRRRDGPDRDDATSAARWPQPARATSPSPPTRAAPGRRRGRSRPPGDRGLLRRARRSRPNGTGRLRGLQRLHDAVPDQHHRPAQPGRCGAARRRLNHAAAPTGAFTELHRGAPGDPRGSSAERPDRRSSSAPTAAKRQRPSAASRPTHPRGALVSGRLRAKIVCSETGESTALRAAVPLPPALAARVHGTTNRKRWFSQDALRGRRPRMPRRRGKPATRGP